MKNRLKRSSSVAWTNGNSVQSSSWARSCQVLRAPGGPLCDSEGTLEASVTDKQEGERETPATKGPLRQKVQ